MSALDRVTASAVGLIGFALLSVLAGAMLPVSSLGLTLVLGVAAGTVLLMLPPYMWATAGMLAAVFSRSTVEFTHPIANFLHFPLVLGGALFATLQQTRSRTTRRLAVAAAGLLSISLVSWAVNGGDVLKPCLDWLVLTEPFLVVYTLLKANLSPRARALLWTVVLGVVFIQVPIAFWQAYTRGLGDSVTGTLGLSKAMGAVAMLAFLALGARMQAEQRLAWRAGQTLGLVVLLLLPILATAKSVFGISLIAILYLVRPRVRNLGRAAAIASLTAVFAYLALMYYPPLRLAFNPDLVFSLVAHKADSFRIFANHAGTSPAAWLIGFGPGNTFSRVALLAQGGIVKSDSPVSWLGLSLAPITREALAVSEAGGHLAGTSSAYQIWFSWAGIFGDLGALGLTIYAYLWWTLWRGVRLIGGWQGVCARSVIFVTVLLGGFYDWFEQPGFTLVAAIILGLIAAEAPGE